MGRAPWRAYPDEKSGADGCPRWKGTEGQVCAGCDPHLLRPNRGKQRGPAESVRRIRPALRAQPPAPRQFFEVAPRHMVPRPDQDRPPTWGNHVRRPCAKSNDLCGPPDDRRLASSALAVSSRTPSPQEPLPLGANATVRTDLAGGPYVGQRPATHGAVPETSRLRRDHWRLSALGRCRFHPWSLPCDGRQSGRGPRAAARISAERSLALGIGCRGCGPTLSPIPETTGRTLDPQPRYRGETYRAGPCTRHRGCPVRSKVAGHRWRRA